MILPNDGKNKNSLICPRSTIKYKVLIFSTAQSCHLVDKRHISNFFSFGSKMCCPLCQNYFSLSLYQFSDFLTLPASMIERHNFTTSTHLKITTYNISFI